MKKVTLLIALLFSVGCVSTSNHSYFHDPGSVYSVDGECVFRFGIWSSKGAWATLVIGRSLYPMSLEESGEDGYKRFSVYVPDGKIATGQKYYFKYHTDSGDEITDKYVFVSTKS